MMRFGPVLALLALPVMLFGAAGPEEVWFAVMFPTAVGWAGAAPIGVGIASAISLAFSSLGHMSGLLPFAFGLCALVFAALCVALHELVLAKRLRT